MFTFIDYGAGNIGSVTRAFERLDVEFVVTQDPAVVAAAEQLVLPGVGHFGATMRELESRGLVPVIKSAIARDVPFLGICVGMQVLLDGSEEAPNVPGLGIIPGMVRKFAPGPDPGANANVANFKVPQIGWNQIDRVMDPIPGMPDCPAEGFAYYVNSYYCEPTDRAVWAMITDYHGDFCAGIARRNLTAVQFHPEKSGEYGLALLRCWTTQAVAASSR